MVDKLTPEILKTFGFEEIPHFTILGSMVLNIGRMRQISVGCIGTPNEMVFISELDEGGTATDLVCISNYDYDGCFTKSKLATLLSIFNHE